MKYNLTQLAEVRNKFREVFNTGFGGFQDNLISAATGQVVIDIVAFNAFLEKEHPKVMESGLSINTAVQQLYGAAGTELLDNLTL